MSDTKQAILEERIVRVVEDIKNLRLEQNVDTRNITELHVKHEQLEKRLVQHSARHESNYKDLQGEFKSLKEDLSGFKGDVLKRLDSMGGRDSVLKFLFGGAIVAIITGLVKIFSGV